MKKEFLGYIYANNRPGSNKASSYIKALEYLEEILDGVKHFNKFKNIYHITNVTEVIELYNFILEQQKEGSKGIFKDDFKRSYWHSRFYSAAINSYKQFLIIYQHEQKLNKLLEDQADADVKQLSKLLSEQKIDNIDELEIAADVEGKDRIQTIKARVNQYYFRKMILRNYNQQCCINGLNIPDVLRASHIIPWIEDKDNRLNPTNGLCLSATYDAAFDRYLISLDDKYRLILSRSLKEYFTNVAFQQHFKAFENKQIMFPRRNLPDKEFLARHRSKLN
jgi:putative restriction endonuclease